MARPAGGVPAHVPAELVWNHVLRDFATQTDDPFVVM